MNYINNKIKIEFHHSIGSSNSSITSSYIEKRKDEFEIVIALSDDSNFRDLFKSYFYHDKSKKAESTRDVLNAIKSYYEYKKMIVRDVAMISSSNKEYNKIGFGELLDIIFERETIDNTIIIHGTKFEKTDKTKFIIQNMINDFDKLPSILITIQDSILSDIL